jgi:hypothetical protein
VLYQAIPILVPETCEPLLIGTTAPVFLHTAKGLALLGMGVLVTVRINPPPPRKRGLTAKARILSILHARHRPTLHERLAIGV